ncbi:MAG TPA: ABC transporter ATP-binding protein [Candidatus Eisenbacteria bacterium]|nr:ABC transporter ATP-binding protein [Candidatus Eisenbacteria bacterium]
MDDPRETRKLAANWREYLTESLKGFGVYVWAWREFVTPKAKRWMRRGVGAVLAMTALGMVEPWLVKSVIDGLIAHAFAPVAVALGGIVALMIVQRLCQWAFEHHRELVIMENEGSLDGRASELFFGKSLGQHLQDNGVLNAANVEKGRNRVLEIEHMMIFEGIPAVAELLLGFVCLWLLSPVGGIVMSVVLGVYMFFTVYMNRRVSVTCTPIDAEFRRFNRHRVERWDCVERVKTSGKEAEELRFMGSWFQDILARDRKFWLWALRMWNIRGLVNVLGSAAIIAYGAWLVWKGDWTVGFLYPFYQWSRRVGDNLWRVGHIEHRLNWNMPSVASLRKALTTPPDVVDAPDAVVLAPDRPLRVELRDIGHTYAGRDADDGAPTKDLHVLKRVSFAVEPGERAALIGPSGAGKTTVMRLLQRYMDPEQGGVLIDGRDLRTVALASWTRLVGYIPQQSQVLDGTLRYNLLYGLPEAERGKVTDEELWDVMRKLKIDFGERLTGGLDTVVGRRGIKLSGGQAQRLMIGSAVLKRPRFMIIDEATSSLDSTTERAVQEGLAEVLPAGTSALIITHRLSTVRTLCSKFIVLKQAEDVLNGTGQQVEAIAGSFEELYAKSPTFRRLADDQGVSIRTDAPPFGPSVLH